MAHVQLCTDRNMEKNDILTYQAPTVILIDAEFEYCLCISGDIEGTQEEDWVEEP